MEIHIHIPLYLQPLFQGLATFWLSMKEIWADAVTWARFLHHEGLEKMQALKYSNVFIPVLAILLVFWPILLSSVMALATAWAWIFWLLTSVVLGVVQLGYATYQFLMIAFDIAGLSSLKTYSIIRDHLLHIIDKSNDKGIFKWRVVRRSRRWVWRQKLEACQSYEEFLRMRIDAKDIKLTEKEENKNREDNVDSALPPLRKVQRSRSFSGTAFEEDPTLSNIPRNRSFSGEISKETMRLLNDDIEHDPIVVQELGQKTADLLVTTTLRLEEARLQAQRNPNDENASSALKYLLSGVVKRNHLKLDDILIENARSVAESGQYGLSNKSRQMIKKYYQEVEKGLDWITEAPILESQCPPPEGCYPLSELGERVTLIRKMKQNMGRSALMLSGGGAISMYHLGVIRALIESKLYNDIKVISGTSGGSISAAMCAIKTSEELYNDVCVPTVSTDFKLNGEMKKKGISWFPSMWDMAKYWMKNKLLVDSEFFQRTCEYYYGNITFEEAFERTGKHVCITVSASRASGDTAQRLLLNHISTPHVTIASAVRASCGLPGVMAPAKLVVKNSNGVLEPFEVDGVEWIDGSVQADLPFQRIATLFAVTSFIVSQTNFHVVPFLNKEHHPSRDSLYWRLFQTMEWDMRSRALKLSRLGLFPRLYGQDISKVFKQKYYGNLTIVPRFTTSQTFGLKALANPTVEDMEGYLKYGQIATWPYLNAIREMIRLEKALDDSLARLEARMRVMDPDIDLANHDDVESIASSSLVAANSASRVRIIGRPSFVNFSARDRESDRLRRENQQLQEEVERLRKLLQEKEDQSSSEARQEKNERDDPAASRASLSDVSEGAIWNLVRKSSTEQID